MIKVIPNTVVCEKCMSLLEYYSEDVHVKNESRPYLISNIGHTLQLIEIPITIKTITCPKCKNIVHL